MKKSYSGHSPLRVPDNWTGQYRTLVIQINNMMDDIYRKLNDLKKEIEELQEEGEGDG